jgi:general transcription factor 3C polypeptide 5 (transcription factor C subunit 1)
LQFTLPKYYFDLALRYVCYQFKSGPFREAIVRYGVDPRSGPEYAKYQTVIFADRSIKGRWADPRAKIEEMKGKIKNSHIFDGKNFVPDGSVYQICDITDPLITNMLDRCSFREKIDNRATGDGYFNNGVLAKIRIIIKAKMVAIMEGRSFTDEDFVKTIEFPDIFEDNKRDSRQILFLVPDIRPTEKEKRVLAIPRDAEVEELGNDARRRRKRKVEWNEDIRRSGGTKVRRQRILPGKKAGSGADTKSATPQPAEKPGLDGTDDSSEDVEVGNDDAEGEEEDVPGRAMDGGDDDGDSSGTDVTDFRSLP